MYGTLIPAYLLGTVTWTLFKYLKLRETVNRKVKSLMSLNKIHPKNQLILFCWLLAVLACF